MKNSAAGPGPCAKHGSAFLGVHRLAAEIFLVQPHVEDVAFAEPVHDERPPAELRRQDVQAGFVQHGEHLAEQDIDPAASLGNDGVKAHRLQQLEQRRDEDETADNRDGRGYQ